MYFQPVIYSTKSNNIEEITNTIEKFYSIEESIKPHNIFKVESSKNSIGIDVVQKVHADLSTKSEEIRIELILEAEKLTEQAQNSILKILEEPPQNSIIVLVVNNIDVILVTIRSRCMVLEDKDSTKETQENDLFEKFIKGNYIERIAVLEEINKDDNNRKLAGDLILYIMEFIRETRQHLDMIEYLEEFYKALKQSTNTKLVLENVNVFFENIK